MNYGLLRVRVDYQFRLNNTLSLRTLGADSILHEPSSSNEVGPVSGPSDYSPLMHAERMKGVRSYRCYDRCDFASSQTISFEVSNFALKIAGAVDQFLVFHLMARSLRTRPPRTRRVDKGKSGQALRL